jgi:hypothetical protein
MRQPTIHRRQATQLSGTLPVEPGKVSLPRAIVLAKEDKNKQTLGFPPINPAEPKRVTFSTPLYARCMSVDGLWSTNCLVLSVWDTGGQLKVSRPGDLTEFFLLFTSSPKPVYRQCKRVRTCGNMIEIAYLRKQPHFLLKADLDFYEPRTKFQHR